MGLRSWASLTRNCCRTLPQQQYSLLLPVRHERESLKGALRRLQLSRASVIGVVLTKYDAKSAGYGYGYGYGYEYGLWTNSNPTGMTVNDPSTSKPQLADLRERLANLRKSA